MEIKKVTTDKFYKEKYVYIDGDVYDAKTALKLFETKQEAMIKLADKNLQPADVVHLKFSRMPSDDKIMETISKIRQEIYNNLHLKPTNSPNKQRKQAFELFKYLINNISYYMPVKEEVDVKPNNNYNLAIEKSIERVKTAELFLNYTKVKLKANHIPDNLETQNKIALFDNILQRHKQKFVELFEAENANARSAVNKTAARAFFKVLLEEKGVCRGYSLAYSYLLNGLGIENKIVSIKYGDKENSKYHALNLMQVFEDGKKQYAYVDVTDNYSFIKKLKEIKSQEKPEKIIKKYLDNATFTMTQDDLERNIPEVEIRCFQFINEFDNRTGFDLESTSNKEQIEEIKKQILKDDPRYKEFYDLKAKENTI